MICSTESSFIIFILLTQRFSAQSSSKSVEFQLKTVLEQLGSTIVVENVFSTDDRNSDGCCKSNMSVLSAFVDIGVIPETKSVTRKDPKIYMKWLKIFESLENPFVFFTNDGNVEDMMKTIRKNKPTLIIRIQKYSTWSFGKLAPAIADIFNQSIYPKHHPNTIHPEYSAVTHAKYEFMQVTSHLNYFRSLSAAWVDIGIYRDAVETNDLRPFLLNVPHDFDDSKIYLNYIRDPKPHELMSHRYIMKYSPSFLSGSFWFGSIETLKVFTTDYRNQVEIMMGEGLANCEEQVMGAMYLGGTLSEPAVKAQFFKAQDHTNCDRWFCLGHKMREYGLSGEKDFKKWSL